MAASLVLSHWVQPRASKVVAARFRANPHISLHFSHPPASLGCSVTFLGHMSRQAI